MALFVTFITCPLFVFSLSEQIVLDNPTSFSNLEWKVLYVANAQDTSKDIVLEEVLVGSVPVGINKFILQAGARNASTQLGPNTQDWLGVTVVLVTCSYREREFIRVGYYVNNDYEGYDPDNPSSATAPSLSQLDLNKVVRTILADITKFLIPWGDDTATTTSTTDNTTTETMTENNEQPTTTSSEMMGAGDEENRSPHNGNTTTTTIVEDETKISPTVAAE